jgi:voltage-gated potassium channel Kch
MAATPFLMRLTDWLERREEASTAHLDGPEESPETSVIVVGYGRFGQTAAQMLMAKGIGVTLVDTEAEMIEVAGSFGTKVYYGDGMRLDLLRLAGAESARAILFCQDNRDGGLTKDAVKRVLEAFPQAAVLVRAFDRVHLMSFDGLDVAFAQRELFESAVKMGRAALEALGLDAEAIDQVDFEYRLRDCERLELQSSTGDLRAGIDRSFSPDRSMADGD